MNEKNWREWFFIFAMGGFIMFAILMLIAMLFYAGGTSTNPEAPGYSLWANSFVDLGRTKAYSGKSNTVSSLIYSIGQIMLGMIFILVAIAIPYFFTNTKFDKSLSYIGSFFFIIVAILTIVMAFRPSDIYENVALGGIWFLALLIFLISYSIASLHNKSFPNKYGFVFIVFLANIVIQGVITGLFAVGGVFCLINSVLRIILAYGFYKQIKFLTL